MINRGSVSLLVIGLAGLTTAAGCNGVAPHPWLNNMPSQAEFVERHEAAEKELLAICIQGQDANQCGAFLNYFPRSQSAHLALQRIQYLEDLKVQKQAVAEQERLEAKFERDKALPTDVRRDKYMVALTTHLKNERYSEAMQYFQLLERLDTELSSSFYYFYGEALLKTGDPDGAITKLYSYITEVGSEGKYYMRALELVNEAESAAENSPQGAAGGPVDSSYQFVPGSSQRTQSSEVFMIQVLEHAE